MSEPDFLYKPGENTAFRASLVEHWPSHYKKEMTGKLYMQAEPVMVNGLTEAETAATASVAGLPPAAAVAGEDVIGAMAYRGNTVSFMYDRAKAYGDEITRCWDVLREAGIAVAGKPLHEVLKAALATPHPSHSAAEQAGRWMPVARVADVHMSRYTIEWLDKPMPEGTVLFADVIEPMGDKALALLDAALSTAGKEQA